MMCAEAEQGWRAFHGNPPNPSQAKTYGPDVWDAAMEGAPLSLPKHMSILCFQFIVSNSGAASGRFQPLRTCRFHCWWWKLSFPCLVYLKQMLASRAVLAENRCPHHRALLETTRPNAIHDMYCNSNHGARLTVVMCCGRSCMRPPPPNWPALQSLCRKCGLFCSYPFLSVPKEFGQCRCCAGRVEPRNLLHL
jgi:hypothetical protein